MASITLKHSKLQLVQTSSSDQMKLSKALKYLCLSVLVSACNTDEFLDVFPEDQYTTDVVYQSEADMILAVNGLYTFLPALDADRGEQRLWFWTDDGWRRTGRFGADLRWSAERGDSWLNFYDYDGIRQCNEVISRIPGSTFETEGIDERLTAEARFIRALLYERMVFLYGDVPLVAEPQGADFYPSRDSRSEVFDFVISELSEVVEQLPEVYESNELGRATRWAALAMVARANLDAIGWHPNPSALYDSAEQACQEIISSGFFNLDQGVDGYKRLFTPDSDFGGSNPSTATILSRVHVDGELFTGDFSRKCLPRGSFTGFGVGAGNNQGQFGSTWNMISSFQTINGLPPADELGTTYSEQMPYENMDPRLSASFILSGDALQRVDGDGNTYYDWMPHPDLSVFESDAIDQQTGIETGYLVRKYSGLGVENDSTIIFENPRSAHVDYKIIRYAEILLMMAECRAADNSNEALVYISEVRNRVGMPSYNSIADVPLSLRNGVTGNELIDAVLLERRYEFAGEGFQRMADIWRYRLGNQVFGLIEGISTDAQRPGALEGERFSAVDRVWDERNYLFPLPQGALNSNPNLTQNPGW